MIKKSNEKGTDKLVAEIRRNKEEFAKVIKLKLPQKEEDEKVIKLIEQYGGLAKRLYNRVKLYKKIYYTSLTKERKKEVDKDLKRVKADIGKIEAYLIKWKAGQEAKKNWEKKNKELVQVLMKLGKAQGKIEPGIFRDSKGKIAGRFTAESLEKLGTLTAQFYMAIWDKIWPEIKDEDLEQKTIALFAGMDKFKKLNKRIGIKFQIEKIPEKKE